MLLDKGIKYAIRKECKKIPKKFTECFFQIILLNKYNQIIRFDLDCLKIYSELETFNWQLPTKIEKNEKTNISSTVSYLNRLWHHH